LGLSDYDIDPNLDEPNGEAGEGTSQGGDRSSQGGADGGKAGGGKAGGGAAGESQAEGGTGNEGEGGTNANEGGVPGQGGAQGQAGMPPVLGALIPCTSAVCCADAAGEAVGVELLLDGGFEDEPQTFWEETSSEGFDLIMTGVEANVPPHGGERLAFLAGVALETSDMETPGLSIPADAGWFELSGYRWFELDSLSLDNLDFAGIGFYSSATTDPLELPFYWDTSGDPGDTTTWEPFDASWSAAPHAGESRYLLVRGSADEFADDAENFPASNYLFDSLSLKMFRCYEPE
jgi:hypothetical protein